MTGSAAPAISVCIVTGRRGRLLDACLESLVKQRDAPPFEVLVIADGDPLVVDAVHRWLPDARVAVISRALPGSARNWLIKEATGDLLLFLDDDVTVRDDLLARLVEIAAEHPDCGVYGGPNVTPSGSTGFQYVQGAVLSSIVGAGPVRRRYGKHPEGEADERFFTLCNLAVRREDMVPFADDIICAEENAMLAELARKHVRMHYDPRLIAYHERRGDWRGFARQMLKYGRGRGQLLARNRRTFRLPYLVPSLFLGYAVVSPLLAMVNPIALAPLVAYAGVVAIGALACAISLRRLQLVPLAAALIITTHVAYGIGVVRGLVERRTVVFGHKPTWVEPTARS